MHIGLTDDQRLFDESLRRYLANHYSWEERQQAAYPARDHNSRHWHRLCELGVGSALFEPEMGGFGGQAQDIALVFEALGNRLVVEPFLAMLMSGSALAHAGKRDILRSIVNGETLIGFAHLDDEADPVVAAPDGGRWRLSGTKSMVLAAEDASGFLVSAKTTLGVRLFLLDSNLPGISIAGRRLIDGGSAGDICFDQVVVTGADSLGPVCEVEALIEMAIQTGLLALSAEALGVIEAAMAMTIDYLRTRQQFGAPLAQFQALQHRVVDLSIEVEQARSAIENAVLAWTAKKAERDLALAAARFTISKVARLVAEEAVQLHGAIGMTWELPISHYAKRLTMLGTQLGSAEACLGVYISISRR